MTASGNSDIIYSGTYTYGIVLGNPATQNPATIAATGLITNNGTALYGQSVTAWTVSNFGTIAGTEGNGAVPVGIVLAAGGTITNAGRVAGLADAILIDGGAGAIVNSGSIQGAASLNAGGSVSNDGGGTMRSIAVANDAGAVANSGVIEGIDASGAVRLSAGGDITNAQEAIIEGGASVGGPFPAVEISGAAGTLVNSGTIIGAIGLSAGGSVVNNSSAYMGSEIGLDISGGAGTIANYGTMTDSVGLFAGGSVTNLGVISVADGEFGRHPAIYYGVGFDSPGTLTNLGTIKADNFLPGPGPVGVSLAAGGYVGNGASGSPGALIAGAYFGVLGYGDSTIVNDGRIAGTGSYGIGVYLGGDNSTLVNAGRVAGAYGTAVFLAGGYGDLRVEPGARFGGAVTAGGSYDTLELAAGSGRLAGLGTKFSGFYNVVVDPGAVWRVSGSAPAVDNDGVLVVKGGDLTLGRAISDTDSKGVIRIAAEGTATFAGAVGTREHAAFTSDSGTVRLDHPLNFNGAITGFRAGDAIDLVNQTADAVNFTDHRLSVTDNGGAVADLRLFGTFTSADFALSPDGHGGTEITLLSPDTLAMKT